MKVNMTVRAVDNFPATCEAGEFSEPTKINLRMVDDTGDVLIDNGKTIVCEGGGGGATISVKRNVVVQSPVNCENGAVPPPRPDFTLGTITSTGSASGTTDYVKAISIKCFE